MGRLLLASLVAGVVCCGGRSGLLEDGEAVVGAEGGGGGTTVTAPEGALVDAGPRSSPDAAFDAPADGPPDVPVLPIVLPCATPAGLQPGSPWPIARRCPARTGQTGVVGPTGPNVVLRAAGNWQTALVIAADGTLYAVEGAGDVVALSPDGTRRWTTTVPVPTVTDLPPYMTSPSVSLAIGADGTLYAWNGDLTALSPQGAILWTTPVTAYPGMPQGPTFGLDIGPDGTIYVVDSNPDSGSRVYGINPGGVVVWTGLLESFPLSSPAIGVGGAVYVLASGDTGQEATLRAFAHDGTGGWARSLRWLSQTLQLVDPSASVVVGEDGIVYTLCESSSNEPAFCAVSPDGALQATFPVAEPVDGLTVWTPGQQLYASSDGSGNQRNGSSGMWAYSPSGEMLWGSAEGLVTPLLDAKGTLYSASAFDGQLETVTMRPEGGKLWTPLDSTAPAPIPYAFGADGTLYGFTFPEPGGPPAQLVGIAP